MTINSQQEMTTNICLSLDHDLTSCFMTLIIKNYISS